MNKLLHTLAAVGLVATPFLSARADLVLVSPNIITLGGTGLGAVNTVLTMQSAGSSSSETGCVAFTGSGDQIGSLVSGGTCSTGGDAKTGASQTQTRTLNEAGINSGAGFTVFFNAAEPGGDAITLSTLVASFYDNQGNLLHSAVYSGPTTFNQTATGTGNTGYEFALNSTQAATLQGFINQMGASNIHVGISASASQATGGNETFFIFDRNVSVSTTPEPASMALVATGLLGLAGVVRRRRQS